MQLSDFITAHGNGLNSWKQLTGGLTEPFLISVNNVTFNISYVTVYGIMRGNFEIH